MKNKMLNPKESKKIIVFDNEPSLLQAIAFTLKRNHYSVVTFSNTQEAMEYIGNLSDCGKTFDLLITDIRLPGESGIELIRRFNSIYRDIPVLAMSGSGDKAMLIELLRNGCADYLDKPFTLSELVLRVSYILEKSHQKTINKQLKKEMQNDSGYRTSI